MPHRCTKEGGKKGKEAGGNEAKVADKGTGKDKTQGDGPQQLESKEGNERDQGRE